MKDPNRKLELRVVAPLALALGLFVIWAPSLRADGADVYGVGGGAIDLIGETGTSHHFTTFAFSAHSGPQGDYGQFRLTRSDPAPPLDVHVDVDCVNVFPLPPGAAAWISGVVKKVSPEPNPYGIAPGSRMFFFVADYGEPPDPMADEIQALSINTRETCKRLGPTKAMRITQGNINIKLP